VRRLYRRNKKLRLLEDLLGIRFDFDVTRADRLHPVG
jgi:hypothetical protein